MKSDINSFERKERVGINKGVFIIVLIWNSSLSMDWVIVFSRFEDQVIRSLDLEDVIVMSYEIWLIPKSLRL